MTKKIAQSVAIAKKIKMNIPTIKGIIKRRLLLNYRVDPDVIQQLLPSPFRPKLHKGKAIAGICLIRLEDVRPVFLPAFMGINSENSAHRIAVEWDTENGIQEGVFVPRRDTDSLINSLAGGRIFPGVHHHSKFLVEDNDGEINMIVSENADSKPLVNVSATETEIFPEDSIFDSLADSSRFFENGCIGYSSRPKSKILDGLLLEVPEWMVSALGVEGVDSEYFDDKEVFPEGSIHFDHALLMRDMHHEWKSLPAIRTE